MSYGYVPQYVTEEPESESDCPSDGQIMEHITSDVTELYRRKHQTLNHHRNSSGTYYHTHMPNCYEQQTRIPATCACNLPPDPRYCYYKTVPQAQEGMFRSSTNISPRNLRTDTKATTSAAIKKYPITARTPRYYRGVVGSQVCKRPSALCLPVTCQPDPAVLHRSRKTSPTEIQNYRGQETAAYAINDYVMRTTAVKRTDTTHHQQPPQPHPVDSEGDVNSRLNDLENFLTKFEEDEEAVVVGEDEGETERVEISGISEISKILKPKVPASVKAKHQNKVIKLKAVKTNLNETMTTQLEKVNKLEVKEAPAEPLDVLLQKLSKENNQNFVKTELEMRPQTKLRRNPRVYSDQKPPLDDNSALELHKSKSYIVSLIDKALSKELGTVPGDKCTRQEFVAMNPKKAIDLVNRHSSTSKNDEKANPNLQTSEASSSKKSEQCSCKTEEPLYLKQLKQLRWSHLRHIQREAKRLADLERFLDSFSEAESSP